VSVLVAKTGIILPGCGPRPGSPWLNVAEILLGLILSGNLSYLLEFAECLSISPQARSE